MTRQCSGAVPAAATIVAEVMVVSEIATLVSAAHGTPAAWADSGASASVATSARDTRRRMERWVMGHLFDAGEQQGSTQSRPPLRPAALAPKRRGVSAPPWLRCQGPG